ncbi:MAG: glycosyltransferase family A protein, partial [Pseudomonadota bacterium]
YPIHEIIVVDDASTVDLSSVAARDPRIRYLRQPVNAGANAARNLGLRCANGDLIAYLDDDDAWRPDKIARQVESFADETVEASLCGLRTPNAGASGAGKVQVQPITQVTEAMLRRGNPFCGMSGLVARREALLAEPFDEGLPAGQDWDVYVRLARRAPLAYVAAPLFTRDYGGHDGITLSARQETPQQLLARARVLEKHRAWLGEWHYRTRLASYLLKYVSRRPAALSYLRFALRRAGLLPTANYILRHALGRDMTARAD